jgi:hypothetical protein
VLERFFRKEDAVFIGGMNFDFGLFIYCSRDGRVLELRILSYGGLRGFIIRFYGSNYGRLYIRSLEFI